MTQSLGRLTVDLVANTGSLEAGFKKAEASTKRLTGETKKQQSELAKLVSQIDPTIAAYERLDKMEEQLRQHRQSGLLPEDDFQNFAKQIEAQRTQLQRNSEAFQGNSKTARELSFAMRNLPAQFTDIAVGIQAGQKPLTILLQQGGQIKDMFGGIGPAIRYMGAYLIGLVNPITIAAAALLTLGTAFFKGSAEADKFNKAIALTGGASGATTDSLRILAQSIDQVVGTQSKAVEVLSQLVGTGKLVEDQFESIAIAAINFERATGQAISETISNFVKLAEAPTKASAELNAQYGYLTATVYQQIAALEEEGRIREAAAIAIKEFENASNSMAENITEQLGWVQKGWRGVKDAISEVSSALLNVGRSNTLAEQIEDINRVIAAAETKIESGIYSRTTVRRLEAARAEREILQEQLNLREAEADAQAESVRINREAIAAQAVLNKTLFEGTSNAEKLQKRYEEINKLVAKAAAGGVIYSEEDIAKLRAAAEKQFREPRSVTYREDAGMRMLNTLREQYAELLNQLAAEEKLGRAAKDLISFQQQIADIKNKDILTADQKALLANEELISAQLRRNIALEEEIQKRKEIEKIQAAYVKLSDQLDANGKNALNQTRERFDILQKAKDAGLLTASEFETRSQQIVQLSTAEAPDISSLNLSFDLESETTKETDRARIKLEKWYAEQLDLLNKNRATMAEYTQQWNDEELALNEEFQRNLTTIDLAAAAERARESQKIFKEFAKEAARNIQSAFADFLFNPFDEGLKGMLKSFATTMQRLAAEQASAEILQKIANATAGESGWLGKLGALFGGARATGGPVDAGKAYLVGENGPEMWVPNQAGHVYNTEQTRGALGGVTQVFNISTPDASSFRASQRQIAKESQRRLRTA